MTEFTKESSGYTDNSPFVRALRTESRVRVLDALLSNPSRPLSVSGLTDKTGMVRSTIINALDTLESMGIVEKSGKVSNATLYKVSNESQTAEKLFEARIAFTTDEEARSGAPEPEEHWQKELPDPLDPTFGDTPSTIEDVKQVNFNKKPQA